MKLLMQQACPGHTAQSPRANVAQVPLRRGHEVHVGAEPQRLGAAMDVVLVDNRRHHARLADARAVAEEEATALAVGSCTSSTREYEVCT